MEQTFYIKANSVAFTGHRLVPESKKGELIKKLRVKIRLLYAMGIRNYYCGMAIGFDMLAAEVVLSLRSELPYLKLIAVVPFKEQSARWNVSIPCRPYCRKQISQSLDRLTLAYLFST